MRNLLIIMLAISTLFASEYAKFDEYFLKKTMRIDFFQTGNAEKTIISIDQIKEEPIWAGSMVNLVDDLELGEHLVKVFDESSGELIFSKGFNSIFAEYVTTKSALDGEYKSYHNTVLIPYPKNNVKITFSTRNSRNVYVQEYETVIDPNSRFVNHEKKKYNYKVK